VERIVTVAGAAVVLEGGGGSGRGEELHERREKEMLDVSRGVSLWKEGRRGEERSEAENEHLRSTYWAGIDTGHLQAPQMKKRPSETR
jgi:hypothetical protein